MCIQLHKYIYIRYIYILLFTEFFVENLFQIMYIFILPFLSFDSLPNLPQIRLISKLCMYVEQVGDEGEERRKEKSTRGFLYVLRRGHH
jgi:hypothetical protein